MDLQPYPHQEELVLILMYGGMQEEILLGEIMQYCQMCQQEPILSQLQITLITERLMQVL